MRHQRTGQNMTKLRTCFKGISRAFSWFSCWDRSRFPCQVDVSCLYRVIFRLKLSSYRHNFGTATTSWQLATFCWKGDDALDVTALAGGRPRSHFHRRSGGFVVGSAKVLHHGGTAQKRTWRQNRFVPGCEIDSNGVGLARPTGRRPGPHLYWLQFATWRGRRGFFHAEPRRLSTDLRHSVLWLVYSCASHEGGSYAGDRAFWACCGLDSCDFRASGANLPCWYSWLGYYCLKANTSADDSACRHPCLRAPLQSPRAPLPAGSTACGHQCLRAPLPAGTTSKPLAGWQCLRAPVPAGTCLRAAGAYRDRFCSYLAHAAPNCDLDGRVWQK